MDESKINKIVEVGKASSEAIRKAASQVKPGVKYIDVAQAAERHMKELGFGMAFPINISVNNIAAHYTPTLGDESVFTSNDLVKIDFGAEKDGLLGDGALTVDLSGSHAKMIEAAELALDNAIATVKAGIEIREIGRVIEETVQKAGFKTIMNLGGHAIEENELHAGDFIPNYDNGDTDTLVEGSLVAIEPFVTTQKGRGLVKDNGVYEIYTYLADTGVRSGAARAVLGEIKEKYSKNPFAARWLAAAGGTKFGLYSGLSELVRAGCIEPNPVLVESGNGIVAQAEVELIVEKGGCKVITLAKQ